MGARLKALRVAAGLTQEGLARKADVGTDAVRKWETGRRTPGLDMAVKLAEALGVTVGVLAGTEPMPKPKKSGRGKGQSAE
jgi:transcriptional regulator with XRE-family HTH domain